MVPPHRPQLFSGYYRIGFGSLALIAAAPSALRSQTLSMKTSFRLWRGNCCFQRGPIGRVLIWTCPDGHGVPQGALLGPFAFVLFDQQQAAAEKCAAAKAGAPTPQRLHVDAAGANEWKPEPSTRLTSGASRSKVRGSSLLTSGLSRFAEQSRPRCCRYYGVRVFSSTNSLACTVRRPFFSCVFSSST